MRFEGITPRGETIKLGEPVSARLDRAADAPADTLNLSFLGSGSEQITRLLVYDGTRTVFDGLVDEAGSTADSGGFLRSFSVRSRAALLLDNEARPQKYAGVSFPMLFSRHAAPYGFTAYSAPDQMFLGEFCVQKGESEWTVLENFCRRFLHTRLTVRPDGSLYAGTDPSRSWRFGDGGLSVISASVAYRFCDLLSEAWVQQKQNGAYTPAVRGEAAQNLGIRRRRFFSFSELAYRRAQDAVENSESGWMTVTLELSGWINALPGDSGTFSGAGYGTLEGLRVLRVVNTLDSGVQTSRVVLRREGTG